MNNKVIPSKKFFGKLKLIFIILLTAIIVLIAGSIIIRQIISADLRKKHEIKTANGINAIENIKIGGINQIFYIRGQNKDNPVLLFLHGGPGYPEIPASYLFQDEWEKYFTVVHFDQRLAGKTYFANDQKISQQEDSMDLRVSDVIEITQYLKKRFSKGKIALIGHSWGSVLGINTIKKRPDLFSVYVGFGQTVNFIQNEKSSYAKTLELATAANNIEDIKTLQSLAPYPNIVNNKYYDSIGQDMMKLRYLQGKYGLGMPVRYIDNLPIIFSPYYSITDLLYYLTDIFKANKAVMKYLVEDYDLRNLGMDYKIPCQSPAHG